MVRRHSIVGVCVSAILLLTSVVLRADKLTLNDGTVIEGTVIKQADRYWVKSANGEARTIPAGDVASYVKGSGTPASANPGTGSSPGSSATPASPGFATIERKIAAADKASAVVTILQDYINSKPSDEDLKHAKDELTKWSELAAGGAEKINGKWVGGEEHKALMEKCTAILKDAMDLFRKNETLQAVKKLEEAQKVYPNSFVVNFMLGYMAFSKDEMDDAMKCFEQAQKLNPKSAEAAANIGLIYFKKKQYERGILQVQKAAELGDTPEIAYDLTAVINLSPPGIQSSSRIKGAVDASHLLASKYNMPPEIWKRGLLPVPLREHRGDEPGEGAISSGTGFVISPDGLILTNRHVVKGGKTFQVILQGGTKVPAEVVVIDDEQDMALIRIKVAKPMATVQLAEHDSPSDGAECTVIGFPLGNRYTASPKVTHGIVTSSKIATEGADVMIDAKVNPGNSGGPILDKSGNVMAIVAMKSLSSQMEDSYGIGISAGKIRQFLEKNKVKSTKAKSDAAGLSVEDIAAKIEPVTVLILTVH